MMRYCYRDRGQQQEDCWAVLRMRDSSACVIMLDPLYRYGKGQFVFYIGGYCRSSAVRLQIPTEEPLVSGHRPGRLQEPRPRGARGAHSRRAAHGTEDEMTPVGSKT
jgi:hypothetical protein